MDERKTTIKGIGLCWMKLWKQNFVKSKELKNVKICICKIWSVDQHIFLEILQVYEFAKNKQTTRESQKPGWEPSEQGPLR